MTDEHLISELAALVAENHCLVGNAMAPFLLDQRQRYQGTALAVVQPASTPEVAEIVQFCARAGISIVPQGGNTSLVGGAVPESAGPQVVVSMTRMNQIRNLDKDNYTITAEAGCILEHIQQAAEAQAMLFPLSLGAQGSCQIGGNLGTNAGGTGVLKYGSARDLVLGLEVVLADGRIWNGLRRLRKDNTGYKLQQLFIGSEGTLGIITAAVLKLFPRPREVHTALVALAGTQAAVQLLARLREASGDCVVTFEYMNQTSVQLAMDYMPGNRNPLADQQHYVLCEVAGGSGDGRLRQGMETAVGDALEAGEVVDAVLAESVAQARSLWRIRESIPEAQVRAGPSIKHDVSVPVSSIPELLERGSALIRNLLPDALVVAFGHIGDGNIHFNVNQSPLAGAADLDCVAGAISAALYALVAELDGSFSAEHGVGQLKREQLLMYRTQVEVDMMRRIKAALDPKGIFNPGKIFKP